MDPRESRRYIMNNPPPDSLTERRPSLLGRLFRRSSSIDEGVSMGSSPPTGSSLPSPTTLEINIGGGGIRRNSITEAVQSQFVGAQKPKPIIKKPIGDPESGIFT